MRYLQIQSAVFRRSRFFIQLRLAGFRIVIVHMLSGGSAPPSLFEVIIVMYTFVKSGIDRRYLCRRLSILYVGYVKTNHTTSARMDSRYAYGSLSRILCNAPFFVRSLNFQLRQTVY